MVGLAGAAGGAAGAGGRLERHLLYVVIVHEADEDAVVGVVPGDAGNHGDLTLLVAVVSLSRAAGGVSSCSAGLAVSADFVRLGVRRAGRGLAGCGRRGLGAGRCWLAGVVVLGLGRRAGGFRGCSSPPGRPWTRRPPLAGSRPWASARLQRGRGRALRVGSARVAATSGVASALAVASASGAWPGVAAGSVFGSGVASALRRHRACAPGLRQGACPSWAKPQRHGGCRAWRVRRPWTVCSASRGVSASPEVPGVPGGAVLFGVVAEARWAVEPARRCRAGFCRRPGGRGRSGPAGRRAATEVRSRTARRTSGTGGQPVTGQAKTAGRAARRSRTRMPGRAGRPGRSGPRGRGT